MPAEFMIHSQEPDIDIAQERIAHLTQSVEYAFFILMMNEFTPMSSDQFIQFDAEVAARPRIRVLNEAVARRAPHEGRKKVSRIVHGRPCCG
jgi:hypothetical protein